MRSLFQWSSNWRPLQYLSTGCFAILKTLHIIYKGILLGFKFTFLVRTGRMGCHIYYQEIASPRPRVLQKVTSSTRECPLFLSANVLLLVQAQIALQMTKKTPPANYRNSLFKRQRFLSPSLDSRWYIKVFPLS